MAILFYFILFRMSTTTYGSSCTVPQPVGCFRTVTLHPVAGAGSQYARTAVRKSMSARVPFGSAIADPASGGIGDSCRVNGVASNSSRLQVALGRALKSAG